jgi:hypothetical protein
MTARPKTCIFISGGQRRCPLLSFKITVQNYVYTAVNIKNKLTFSMRIDLSAGDSFKFTFVSFKITKNQE